MHKRTICFLLTSILLLTLQLSVDAQEPAPKDVLTFNDGEKLIGKLKRSTGTSVVFHSDMAGDVTVDWSKVKELTSQQTFAVVPKGVNLEKKDDASGIPRGAVSVAGEKLQVQPSGNQPAVSLDLKDTADVVDAATFEKAVLRKPAWYQKWKGQGTVGLSLVNSTQKSQNLTSAVSLVRAIPGEDWLNPENRTSFNFNSSFGRLTQAGSPEIKTSIYHADAERDHYFNPSLYLFAEAAFDHDFSLGLDLAQTLGSGLGWTVYRTANSQFDVKGQIAYINQMFSDPNNNQKLVSSVFAEAYNHKFANKITVHEDISVSPAWNNPNASSATANLNLTIPVIKRFAFTSGVFNTFLNNPSPGFRKNSFQFTSGITYVIP